MATKVPGNTRYEKFVERINKISDVSQLRKIIHRRNSYLRNKIKKSDPTYAKKQAVMDYPPIADLRIITQSTYKRLNKIKDPNKLVDELRNLIINTTRRKYRPKVAADYSNKEIDYLNNAVSALDTAVSNWGDDVLRMKIQGSLKQVTVEDINEIFADHPDYWAISSGYYYAVEEFDGFMDHIFTLVEKTGVKLNDDEKEAMKDGFFKNDPRDYSTDKD